MKSRKQTHQGYLEIIKQAEKDNEVQAAKRTFCQHDLFFLLVYVLHRQDIDRDWLFDRCREVQHDPNGYLDLWARDHYKSSIITYGLTIQDILNNPEITVGIFSFIRPIAKSFMRQIKTDFESNEELKELFPDIFWSNPRKEAPKWSEDDGIVCKRKSNPKEATIEAWGLVDGMPTGRHYKLRVYDDIITEKSVTTPEMINKVTTAWELSQNLGQEGGEQRIIGTRYHFADTYHVMMERGSVIPREYPATKDGKAKGEPVLISQDSLNKKRRDQGPYVFSCQMLLDPVAEEMQELKPKWLQYWPAIHYTNMNLYLFCDPAGEKKKTNDYTVFTVWGLGPDNNYYVIEWIRDRMNLTERANVLFTLQRRYNPDRVIYEKYGMQSDIEHYQDRMNRENYRFRIEEIGGQVNKEDRIRKLIPLFEQGRIYIPETCVRVNLQGKAEDLTQIFIKEEYLLFPFSVHDDMLDCMARIVDTRTDRPDLLDDFMGLDFQNLKDRNVLAMKDFERRQQTNEYSVLTDGMR
jgi:predicted phage terminase large subunit-like protein